MVGVGDGTNVFDRDGLLRRADGDEVLAAEIVDLYLVDAAARLDSIRIAVSAGDTAEVRRHGHALKGASDNVGAVAVRDAAFALEGAATDEPALVPALLDEVRVSLRAFRRAVERAGIIPRVGSSA